MRSLALLLVPLAVTCATAGIDAFGYRWTVPEISDWKMEQYNGEEVLHLAASRGPLPGPRRPIQFALAETPAFDKVEVEADVEPLGRSLMIVFAYRDAAHFDYAHLSTDTAAKETVHNGVFHVYGGERVRISAEDGPAAFPIANHWYHVQLAFDGGAGTVNVLVDGKDVPALRAVDLSLHRGQVGIGSFDETALFRNVKIRGSMIR